MGSPRSTAIGIAIGVAAGAAAALLFDPTTGRRRRALIRDKAFHVGKTLSCAARDAAHDLGNRMQGTRASFSHLFRREPVSDEVLVERVRAELGRVVSHPHAVHVDVREGHVTVSGPVPADEAGRLLSRVRRVNGVAAIVDHLEKQAEAGGVPSLQGGRA
jgi:osmotically-inducible protein OsmY